MSLKKLFLILLICGGVVALFVYVPEARQAVANVFHKAKEDIGPGPPPTTIGGDVRVYQPRGDRYYHRKGCPRMEGKSAVPMALSKAKAIAQPCPECNPPR